MSDDEALARRALHRLHEVQSRFGCGAEASFDKPFADVLDSMGLVEFLGALADDCGVEPADLEAAAGGRFSTLGDLIRSLLNAGIRLAHTSTDAAILPVNLIPSAPASLAATVVRLPRKQQTAAEIDALLDRPEGWFQQHTGISSRYRWGDEDPLDAVTIAARDCLSTGGLTTTDVAALFVTGEAPPRLVGLAATLHARLGLPAHAIALEVGGACMGFLHALALGQRFVSPGRGVLVAAVEAPSRWLDVAPGAAGESAALFGDAAAVSLLRAESSGSDARAIVELSLGCDGTAESLLTARSDPTSGIVINMQGPALAGRAVAALTACIHEIVSRHVLSLSDLAAVIVHAGNGRLPLLLARKLGLPPERLFSTTARTGNLGSVSLPAAWREKSIAEGPVVWAGVGAGLNWGALLLGSASASPCSHTRGLPSYGQ